MYKDLRGFSGLLMPNHLVLLRSQNLSLGSNTKSDGEPLRHGDSFNKEENTRNLESKHFTWIIMGLTSSFLTYEHFLEYFIFTRYTLHGNLIIWYHQKKLLQNSFQFPIKIDCYSHIFWCYKKESEISRCIIPVTKRSYIITNIKCIKLELF